MSAPTSAAQDSTTRPLGQEAAIVREKMEAMRSFEARLDSDPHDAEALERLGMLQFEVGQIHESMRTFEKLVETSPMDPAGRFWLARALDATGRKEDARIERKIGGRLLERPQMVPGEAIHPESGPPGMERAESGLVSGSVHEPKSATLESKLAAMTTVGAETRSRLRFGLEEAILLIASLGILVLFMNILVRI